MGPTASPGDKDATARERRQAQLAGYDEIVARHGAATDARSRARVAGALIDKAGTLWQLGRPQDALVACEEALRRVGDGADALLAEQATRALFAKGTALLTLRRFREAVLAYDAVITRCAGAADAHLQDLAARAQINENFAVSVLEHHGGAAGLPEDVRARLAAARRAATARAARQKLAREPAEFLCPVCGYRMPEPPWDRGIGSQEICPCCGIQFGYDDAREDLGAQIHAERREQWVAAGMRWHSRTPPPSWWDPESQLDGLRALADDGDEAGPA